MNNSLLDDIIEDVVKIIPTILAVTVVALVCIILLSFFQDKPEKQIMCLEKEVYVLGKGNVSCILCKDVTDNYMSCDYDSVNRSLKGVFYR